MLTRITTSLNGLILLLAALLILPACSTDITIDSSIQLSAEGEATMRFQPIPPTGTIAMRNTGPDRARLEFFGPSLDNPAATDRLLTVDLGPGGSSLQSISGVQRIKVTMIGSDKTSVIYTIRSRDGVGFAVDAGHGAIATMGEKPTPEPDKDDSKSTKTR